jgi:hypothetical protein
MKAALKMSDRNWKRFHFNVMVNSETGNTTAEPLIIVAADYPVTCEMYARDNNLPEEPGWQWFKSIAKRQNKLLWIDNQAKLRSHTTASKYQYGCDSPRGYTHAVSFDEKNVPPNGKTPWNWKCCNLSNITHSMTVDTLLSNNLPKATI